MKKKGIILLLDILLSWVVFYVCDMWLSNIFGPDIVEYENWFGDLENTVAYRFGIGSVEILLALLQAVLFIYIEIARHKKKISIVTLMHAFNFVLWVLFYIDWNSWANIPRFLVPQYIVQGLLYGI